jgi:2-(1,2-epoxy-1,2-dihydrophenyl)acetyl-CoA isomerase
VFVGEVTVAGAARASESIGLASCAGNATVWTIQTSGQERKMTSVKQTRDRAVGLLTLNDPASLNAMTPELLGGLATAIGEMTGDPALRALVLTGEGRGFCSGQNLKASESLGNDIVGGVMRHYWPAFRALRECRVPVIVAVNGVAAGGGFSLAMAGDIIVAARSAKFIQVFSRIGLVPDLGSTWLLPRLLGRQRALELMLLNEPLSAERALEWGLVRQVVDDDRLLDEAMKLAHRLAEGPTRALVATRQLLEESEHASYSAQFRREIEIQADIRRSDDALEGRNAFMEKRPARFGGR